ncbi:MAG: YybH family protein [Longimicrobiales bacterium]
MRPAGERCGCKLQDTADASAAIRALQDTNTAAVNSRDAAAWAATFADDATVFPANAEAVTGRAALEQFAIGLMSAGAVQFAPGELQINVVGDVAYVTFPWTLTITPPSGPAIQDRGNTLDVLRRQADGTWRFHRVMWNSALPMPASGD